MISYYFGIPFALNGDKLAIPSATQPDGSVSYNEGWSADYSAEQGVDPDAKDVARLSENQFKFSVTEALKELQENGFKVYDPLVNYPVGGFTIGSDDILYVCLIANGPASIPVVDPVGDLTSTWKIYVPDASTLIKGIIELATDAEAQAFTSALLGLTPATMDAAQKGANQALTLAGFQKFAGGLVVQWNSVTLNAPSTVYSLPTTFPTAGLVALAGDFLGIVQTVIGVELLTTTQITLDFLGVNPGATVYFTIGY